MLEYGSDVYHQSVLWIIHEYLVKLEEGGSIDIDHLSDIIMKPVSVFIKVHVYICNNHHCWGLIK